MRALRLAPALCLLASPALADEGQWPPGMLSDLDPARLKTMGLERPVGDLWSADGGLMRAVVNFGGCSGAFISKDGLFATNHHCAYPALQAASSVEHDYLKDGFVAKTQADELQAKGRGSIRVLLSIEDVTAQIRGAAAGATDDAQRKTLIDKATHARAQACEAQQAGLRCDVRASFFGARYELHTSLHLKDVRLVFAPPAAVGEYGGEIDNWMWPRHSGDFTLLRAYVGKDGKPAKFAEDNVPYRPKHVLEVGAEGVAPDDFVAILGYPGRTRRYLWAGELAHHAKTELPGIVDLYGEWLYILREASKSDRARALRVAAHKKGIANRHKNARGMLAGIERMKLVERRADESKAMLRAVKESKDLDGAQALSELRRMSEAHRKTFPKDLLLGHLSRGPRMLWVAMNLLRRAKAREQPDEQRRPAFQDRNASRLLDRMQRVIADYDVAVESRLLSSWLRRARALPADARLPGLLRLGELNRVTPEELAPAFLHGTLVRDPEWVEQAFENASVVQLRDVGDGVIKLAYALLPDMEAYDQRRDHRAGALIRLAPAYLRLLQNARPGALYPDANGTLRVSVAQVMGYAPRDGLLATPQTSLQGQVAKHTGEAPFDLPARVREAAAAGRRGYFADPGLEDVPVCFLSNGDTTGGNSGSPVIDGRGRWVGLNFDRVWENIAGDVAYNPPQSRNVSVDVRYILWLLSVTPDADRLLDELGVRALAAKPRRAAPAPKAAASSASHAPTKPAKEGKSSCVCVGFGGPVSVSALALVGLFALRRRRAA